MTRNASQKNRARRRNNRSARTSGTRTKAAVRTAGAEEKEGGPKVIERPKKQGRLRYVLLYLAAIGFVFYAVITSINQNVKIAEKRAELSELQQHINVVEIESDYLEKVQNYKGEELSEYMEKIAKEDLGYVSEGERIFINVAGD